MAGNRPGMWRPPGKGFPGMGFSSGLKGGKGGGLSESMSLLEEMKLKQEKREQRKRLREEVDSLMASSPQDITRIARLRQELSFVEGFLAQADGNLSLPTHQPAVQGPLTSAEGQDTNNLYVGSLSTEWTEEMLSREFGRFGEITSIKIMYPRTDHQRMRGMNSGFVQFKTRAQAELARAKLNGKEYFNMCLRIDWGRAIQPARGAVIIPSAPAVVSKPALMPHMDAPKPMPMPITEGSASSSGERKSRWNLAKTLVVKVPEDLALKRLIDKTAEFVADDGWEFEKLLMDKEKDNPRYAFLSVDKENLENPLHLYYRWRTFSFAQGDNDRFWRTEPFQIYENGPLWQPPACDKRVPQVPMSIGRIEMLMPSSGGRTVSTSGKDFVIGGVGLTPEESRAFHELIGELSLSRSSILKAMAFCLDKSMSSMSLAQKIAASIIEAQSGLTTQQLVARMYLLNDVLYNSHCTKPGASQYRRQFQDLLCDVMERLREVCDGIPEVAATALRDRVQKLVENWTEWALFPPRYTKGLEAVLCSKPETSENLSNFVQQAQQHWQSIMDVATLERACRQRGLSVRGARQDLLRRLCLFEAYWPPESAQSAEKKLAKDLDTNGKIEAGLDGESFDCPEETRPSLGLTVVLLPERWTPDGQPKFARSEPSLKKLKKEAKEKPTKSEAKSKENKVREAKQVKEVKEKEVKEVKSKEKTPEEQRQERLQRVEAEVERYRQQLEKAREQPDVMQMKCDRRRMELLGAAAHQESWHERAEEVKVKAPEPEATEKAKQDSKSGKEREKDAKSTKVREEAEKDHGKGREREKDKEKDREKEKESKDKERGKEKEKAEKSRDMRGKDVFKEEAKEKAKAKEAEKDRKKRSRDRSSSVRSRKRRATSPIRPKKR